MEKSSKSPGEELRAEDKSDSSTEKKKKVTFVDRTLEQDEDNIGEDNCEGVDAENGYLDYDVPHAYYRELISEGFEKRAPSKLAPNKTAYFPIDDPVTRSLTTSKYTAKAIDYIITLAKDFSASVTTKAALDDAITANN